MVLIMRRDRAVALMCLTALAIVGAASGCTSTANIPEEPAGASDQIPVASVSGAATDACVPDCTGRFCGDDGCGGSCGNCLANQTCRSSGTCACFGGVNSLKNRIPQAEAIMEVYKGKAVETMPSLKISDIVQVDLSIPGCPVSKDEVERILVGIVTRSQVSLPTYPVCVDCKQRLNTCLFDLGEICLGPISRAGCDAVCPTGKTPCLGCRGPAEELNMPAFLDLVKERGLSLEHLTEKLSFYNAFEPLATDET